MKAQKFVFSKQDKISKEIFDRIQPKSKAQAVSKEFEYVLYRFKNDTLNLNLGHIFEPLVVPPNEHFAFLSHPIKIEECDLNSIKVTGFRTSDFNLGYSKLRSFGAFFDIKNECHLNNDSIGTLAIMPLSSFKLRIDNTVVQDFTLTASYPLDLSMSKVTCTKSCYMTAEFKTIDFYRCNILNYEALGIHVTDAFSMYGCRFSNYCQLDGRIKKLSLRTLFFDNDAILDIRNCFPDSAKKMVLAINNVPLDHIRLNWRHITLSEEDKSDYEEAKSIYIELIENFKQHQQLENLELVDKEYQSYRFNHFKFLGLGWIWDKVVWLWWDYGYGGWQVVLWMMLLPFFWAMIIYRFYPQVYEKVYKLENYKPLKISPRTRTERKNFFKALLYVSVIFFTLNIKLEKLKYESTGLLFVFLLIYLNGIFCLFFLVNFLLKT